MKLETERLRLIPLSLRDLERSIVDKGQIEKEYGLISDESVLSTKMKVIYQKKIDKIKKNPKSYLYYTYWQIVNKSNNKVMGTIGYKGIPNTDGKIEVGYGLTENHRGFGYMTEAFGKLIEWAFYDTSTDVKSVLATTLKDNTQSQNVLRKIGMSIYEEHDNCFCFMIDNRKYKHKK